MMSLLKSLALLTLSLVLLPVSPAAASPAELLAAGRVDDAIASLQAQLKSAPMDAASYNSLCRAYYSVQDWDSAAAACEKAASLAPNNSDYHLWLGRVYGEKADRVNPLSAASLAKKVKNQFETAVSLNPDNADARTDLGEFYLYAPFIMGGGVGKARSQAAALAKIAPPSSHYLYARIAEKDKDLVKAENEYRAAIDASNGNGNAWLNLALFYKHMNRFDEMEQAIQRAVEAPAGRNEVVVECAELLVRAGRNTSLAAQLVRRYLSSNSPSEKSPVFRAHYVLGTALEKQGDKQGAAREYRASLALASNFYPAKDALSRISR
jgi:tetratricopeptide (TPR) repeat protein